MGDRPSQTLSERKRAAILAAAVHEFLESGYDDVRMDEVAARAGVSKRTLYKHFDGKEALFREIVEAMFASFSALHAIVYDPARPLEPQLRALAWVEGDMFCDADRMARVRLILGRAGGDPALAEELSHRIDHLGVFRRFFADAQAAGALSAPDPSQAADQFLALLKAQGFWPTIRSGRTPSREEMTRIVDGAVHLMLAAFAPTSRHS